MTTPAMDPDKFHDLLNDIGWFLVDAEAAYQVVYAEGYYSRRSGIRGGKATGPSDPTPARSGGARPGAGPRQPGQKAMAWARRLTSRCRPARSDAIGVPGSESSSANSQRRMSVSE